MATEDVRDFESSINLIDFKTPTKYACENYAIPLIPAPSITLSYLPPRDSLDNNPFDQMFKATNKTPKTDDPFDLDYFIHNRSETKQFLNTKSNPLPRKTYSDADCKQPDESRSLHDSDFLSPIFTPEKLDISSIPKNGGGGGFVTPTNVNQVLRPMSEMRQVDYEKKSPGSKIMKRACSVGAKDAINVDEIIQKIRNLKRDDSFSNLALNDAFLGSTLGGVSDSQSEFSSDMGLDPTIDYSLPQLRGRKSFSARKPTKLELGRSESMLRNLATKKFNFKERLDQLCLEEEFENSNKITDHEELIFQEAKELADTFSKFADESVNIEDVSAPDESIEIELLPNDPNFYQIDELESGLTTGKDIFKQIDKLFKTEPKIDKTEPVTASNIAKVYPTISTTVPQPRVLKDLTNTSADNVKESKITKISGKKRYDAIDLLENLSKLLTEKNSKEDRNGIKDKLVTSLANILNDDNTNPDGFDSNPDGFDSTSSFDEDILNEENVKPVARNKSLVSSEKEIAKVAPNVIKRVRAVSFSNSFNCPKVTKKQSAQPVEKPGNFLQKLSQKLRPKKPLDKVEATNPQHSVKPLAKKGPIKAVIPINNMAKVDTTKKTLTKAKTLTSLRMSGIVASSTPKSGNSNIKAGSTQSTPKSTLTKRRASSSSIGFSPIVK